MNYLENPICSFKPLWDIDYTKKENIFCSVFFKMKEHYKNFDKYVNGLSNWVNYMNNIKYNYKFRIFIDQNVYEDERIMKIIKSCPRMQPVLFVCAGHVVDKYHMDLFGTLVRYFPLFDFPNNDSKKVFIVDIDFANKDEDVVPRMDYVIDFSKKYNHPIVTHTFDSALLQHKKEIDKNLYFIISNFMLFPDKKYDRNLILKFIEQAPEIKDVGAYNKRLTPFGFGVDELFINKYFIQHINESKMGFLSFYYPSALLWKLINLKLIINIDEMYKILRYILGKYYERQATLEDMINVLDSAFYQRNIKTKNNKIFRKRLYEKNEMNIYLARRIYSFLKESLEKKYKWIDLKLLKFLIDNQDGIIASIAIANYNFKKNKVDKVYNLNKLSL